MGPVRISAARSGSRTARAAACALLAAAARAQAPAAEPVLAWPAIDNGAFDAAPPAAADAGGVRRIPWWRSARGAEQLEGGRLRTAAGEWAEQPVAAYAPLARGLAIRGRAGGAGRIVVTDGSGARATFDAGGDARDGAPFRVSGEQLDAALGHAPLPRLVLRLEPTAGGSAWWDDVAVDVPLPCPGEDALRAEVAAQLDLIFTTWEQRALDDLGPRRTAFVARSFDVVTGAPLGVVSPAPVFFPLQQSLLDACAAADRPAWRALLERYLDDVFALGLHPRTGLPCWWDPREDRPVDDRPVEIALPLGFLIDVAHEGPERFRERARDAARRIGDLVLAQGLLPDGNVAASYLPRDGTPNLDVSQLRRLDVPCQLARLARLVGDARYLRAAREALATLEFAHYWAGSWDGIDPAFDDEFGHYGARAATIALALPQEALFRRFALEGLGHFLPLWRDALRLGGNLAADQVRCWRVASDLAAVEPALKDEVGPLLRLAVRAHVRGEQYGNGAWGDVTIYDFGPRTVLQVGDYPGTPQNLLNGLAAVYSERVGLRTDEVRALYTAVLRSSVVEYGRPYGFLLGRGETRGGTHAGGSLRVLLGLTTMLRRLAGVEEPR
jgi:hypothetical protein